MTAGHIEPPGRPEPTGGRSTGRTGGAARGLLFVCLALAASLTPGAAPRAGAQAPEWIDASGQWGFSGFHELGDGTLYAVNENVLYRSFDGGVTWENFPRPGGPILEFAVRGTTTVLAVQRNVVNFKQYFLSTDRGNTWTRFVSEPNPIHMGVTLPASEVPHALFPVGSRLAFERFVGGAWERLGVASGVPYAPGAPLLWTRSAIDDAGTFYIGTTSDGIHSSRDSGRSWTKALPYRYVSNIAFSPGGRAAIGTMPNGRTVGGVFISDDHGATWNVGGLTDLYMSGMVYNQAGDLLVLGARESGGPTCVYRMNAGSSAWDSAGTFDFDYGTLHMTHGGKYVVSSPGLGMLTSTDGGSAWRPDGVRKQDLISLVTAPDGSLLAGTAGKGVFRTTDSGGTWGRSAGPDGPVSFYAFLTVETTLYAGTEKGLYTTPDNGVSWSAVLSDGFQPDTGHIGVSAILRAPSGDLLVGTGAGVFRRREGADVWEHSGLGASSVRAMALSPDGTIYAATGAHGVLSSSDDGASWTPRGLEWSDLQSVGVSGSGRVIVGASGGVYVSTNGGASWTERIFTWGHVRSILFNGNFNVFAGTTYGVFVSSDAGGSWFSAGLDGAFVTSLAYDAQHSIAAAVYKGGVMKTAGIITALSDPDVVPASAFLSQNYPNPFNPSTTIAYTVPSRSRVTLRVYDLLGRVSETLVSGEAPPGEYRTAWDGAGRPSGVYITEITIEPVGGEASGNPGRAYTAVRKMLLVR
jgi:hypothetical protein